MHNHILKHYKIVSKTDALNAALQYRNHPSVEILYNYDEQIPEPILKHIRTCAMCSKLHNEYSSKDYVPVNATYTIDKLEIGDIINLPTNNVEDTDRANDKNEYFNPPEVCVLEIKDNEILLAQCFPSELKPVANKGDFLTNEGYYVEAWNQYTLPLDVVYNATYEYDIYFKKAVSKKLMKNIVKYRDTYRTNNSYVDKFRENEIRISKIWYNLLTTK